MRDIVLLLDGYPSASASAYDRAARALGLRPMHVTRSFARRRDVAGAGILPVSGMDFDAILSAVGRIGSERIAGVFAGESARAGLAARLAAALGRPHADPDAISLCEEKHRLRALLARRGLDTVDFRHVATVSEARAAAENLAGPVVLKPTVSIGSEGARICQTPDEAALHAKRLLKRRPAGVLAETYVDGPQYSVEMFDGEPLVLKRIHMADGPVPIVVGADAPAAVPPALARELESYAATIVKEVGLTSGPCFVELRRRSAGMHLIEVNPRPASSELGWPAELAQLHLKFACGIPYARDLGERPLGGRVYAGRHVVRNGASVRAIDGLDAARKVPGVPRVDVYRSSFRRRGAATSSLDWIVTVYSEADRLDAAVAAAEAAIDRIHVVYDRFPMELIKYHVGRIRRLGVKLSNRSGLLR